MNKFEIAKEKGYYITDDGTAYSVNKKLKLMIKSKHDKCQYYYFNIKIDGNKNTKIEVHRLQAYQKFGDKMFEDGIVVRHLDGNSLNNSYSNIEIGTYKDNSLDIPKDKRMELAVYASNFMKKHNHEDIYQYYCETKSYKKTMLKFDLTSKGTLNFIIKKYQK